MKQELKDREVHLSSDRGIDRFYRKYEHAKTLGYDWDYHPPEHYTNYESDERRIESKLKESDK